jgi:hypothetical protein
MFLTDYANRLVSAGGFDAIALTYLHHGIRILSVLSPPTLRITACADSWSNLET